LRKQRQHEQPYYQALEEKSRALQNRVSDIMRYVDFTIPENNSLLEALQNFKKKDDNLVGNLPEEFLRKAEKQALEKAGSKVTLYKALLAAHLSEHIKAGKINLTTSFQYRSFESYLIDEITWQNQKQQLLEKAVLLPFENCDQFLARLKERLKQAYGHTFERIEAGTNEYVAKRKDGRPRFTTQPTSEDPEKEWLVELFPQDRFVPISEVLHTVNRHCRFIDCLEHWNPKYRREPPNEKVFFAGLLAYGCNIGLYKMAHTSKNLSLHTLESTVNWYFSLENIVKANDAIVALMGKMKVGELFKADPKVVHTSSDGQKFYIMVDSIHANYSYKYFGKEKGIVIYSFIDQMHRLFYSTTFSASEREAGFVLDGLMHNQVVQSDIHSTDTHGFSERIFALSHLLGIEFAPRIKNFQEQNLYRMEGIEVNPLANYSLKIGPEINTELIKEQWDTLLRMAASIKLKHVSASALLRRLNSYSQQHPVYLALREMGRVIRTLFLLKYMDDEGLRKRIDHQLEKIESAHRFARAVFYANNGEIRFASKEEQLLTDACKRLIQNAIICWNYLYLTRLVVKASEKDLRDHGDDCQVFPG
jgi:TnpA family transposase